MSTLKVEVVQVEAILPHPNADRLEIAQIKGWQCVTGKGNFDAGDLAIYFPIDSVLPEPLEVELFKDSKVKLSKHRIKTIKLRGVISQGMLVPVADLYSFFKPGQHFKPGDDVTELLGVTKYEPPESISPQSGLRQTSRKQTNPNFHKYTDIENYKNHPSLFEPGEQVWVLEKIHGTNFRAGWVRFHADTWWKKVKCWIGMAPEWEFVYGSHNVQLQNSNAAGYHGKTTGRNVYLEAVEAADLRNVLKPGEVVYGEIYGDGIQKGYMYDCRPGERGWVIFDVQINGRYIDHEEVLRFCDSRKLPTVPVDAYISFDAAEVAKQVTHPSRNGGVKVREGVVIKPQHEQTSYIGRKILKWKNDEFLMKVEDDTH